MQYARMYTAPDGASHFEEGPTDLPLVEAVPGNPPIGLSKALPASAVRFCSLPDGWTSSYQPSPQGGFPVILAVALDAPSAMAKRVASGQVSWSPPTMWRGRGIGTGRS